MIAAIMQPYFFPYIGYFQLIQSCDVFVILDDVQYIKNGWVNRNRILVNREPAYISIPVLRAAHRLPINERHYQLSNEIRQRLIRRIEAAYHSAPYFDRTMGIVREIMAFPEPNVAAFNEHLLRQVATHLDLPARIVKSSELSKDTSLARERRVMEICRVVGADRYVNPINGAELYSPVDFARNGIALGFLQSAASAYPQLGATHVPSLSIIDVLMFNGPAELRKLLSEFTLTSSA